MGELTRFWLETRHGCFIRESVPVAGPFGQSDIDFMAVRADGERIRLPFGDLVGPRLIVESKDEHDFDPKGNYYGKRLLRDIEALGEGLFVPSAASNKVAFTMLKQQHFEVATRIFGTDDFDRVFVVHAICDDGRIQDARAVAFNVA